MPVRIKSSLYKTSISVGCNSWGLVCENHSKVQLMNDDQKLAAQMVAVWFAGLHDHKHSEFSD